ncbi:hypothetical protein SAMD00023353_1500940 [Rosellinia necatrix]|uniref:Uncharacterized protein n=1 Tax=Rosellinia necatrix TaxID=77044 RepID=A0A1S8A767_ROSNE|nr:hypothetical protein SAMD00023353_1500940 [Rosellinia necatrix]
MTKSPMAKNPTTADMLVCSRWDAMGWDAMLAQLATQLATEMHANALASCLNPGEWDSLPLPLALAGPSEMGRSYWRHKVGGPNARGQEYQERPKKHQDYQATSSVVESWSAVEISFGNTVAKRR